jgi:hypothetical protein
MGSLSVEAAYSPEGEKKLLSRCKVFLFWLCLTMSGCSWQTYNRDAPDEYHNYWQNEENRKNSILYPFTDEYADERKGQKR